MIYSLSSFPVDLHFASQRANLRIVFCVLCFVFVCFLFNVFTVEICHFHEKGDQRQHKCHKHIESMILSGEHRCQIRMFGGSVDFFWGSFDFIFGTFHMD
jgi:hypothetical protein